MTHEPQDRQDSKESNEAWLNVLAGKAKPHDPDTRQAAALRNFFAEQAQHTEPLEEAAKRRILNTLQTKGAFAQAQPANPVEPVGVLTHIKNWLFPQGHASSGRLAGMAVAVLAATLLPFVLHGPGNDDDPNGIKSLPPVVDTPSTVAPTAVIDSATPDQLAAQLVAMLARHGVVATLRSEGTERWVQSQVPPEKLVAVQAELVSMGLAATPTGQLVVQFRRQP